MKSTRREFLASGISGAGLLATGASLPGFLTRTAWAACPQRDQPILVVVQMTGGNDGLNTVVPFEDDAYHRARPSLRVQPAAALKLDDQLALHPQMRGFKDLYDQGLLTVINNVGYPNPNRSHFEAMDIWHTADVRLKSRRDGWLGRLVDQQAHAGQPPFALHLDSESLPLALKTTRRSVPSVRDIAGFHLRGDVGALARSIAAPRNSRSEDLLFVQRVAVSSVANAGRIEHLGAGQPLRSPYPDYRLAKHLQQIARLIEADFGPRVYYTSIGGFDTHARQVLAHGPLLRELSDSVAAFFADLKQHHLQERVTLMTFSEFGRRVKENASRGTDHGAGAPMFVVSPACRSGLLGGAPDLTNLLDGDVRHRIDFRNVYAAVLRDWLAIPHEPILGGKFTPAALFRT